jgi:hypothetical protein
MASNRLFFGGRGTVWAVVMVAARGAGGVGSGCAGGGGGGKLTATDGTATLREYLRIVSKYIRKCFLG